VSVLFEREEEKKKLSTIGTQKFCGKLSLEEFSFLNHQILGSDKLYNSLKYYK